MKKIDFFLFILLIPVLIFSDSTKIDSLHNKLKTAESIEKIELLIELSLEYVEIDTAKSFTFSNQALELSDNLGKHKALAIGNSGYIYYLIGNHETALILLIKALTQLDFEDNLEVRANVLKNIGLVYIELEEYDRSLEYLNRALNIYLEMELKSNISEVYYSIGNTYSLLNSYKKALEYFHKSLSLDKELNDKQGMAILYYIIGDNYELLAEYVKALESYFNCLKLYEELSDQVGIADSYNAIGNIFQALGDFEIALEYYQKYLEIQLEVDDKYGISIAYNNLGIIYDDNKDFDKALVYYFQALEIDEELNDKDGLATVTNNIGVSYYQLKKYDKALKFYQQSLSLSKEMNDIWAIANTSNNIAELYLSLSQYTESFSYVDKGIEYADSIQAEDLKLESFHIYSKLYSKTNNYKKAFEYFRKYVDLKDSLLTTSIRKVAELQRINETEKKEKENELLRKDNQIKDLQIEKQKNIRYSMFIIIVLVIFSFILVFRRYQDKKKENKIIIEHEKMITQQNVQLDHALKDLKKLNINLEKRVEKVVADIREKENMLIAQSRLATMGEMIGNIAHQWRQPLSAVGIIVQNYEDAFEEGILDRKYLEEHSDKVMDILQQMSRTIDDFRNFFKPNKFVEEFNVKSIVESTISFVKESFRINSINLELNLDETCSIKGFPNEYSQVILNLLNNAKDVFKEHNIKIEKRKVIINLFKENQKRVLTIADTGGGIPEDIISRIFEPYFTTKDDEKGTGLGLYMSKTIIEDNMKGKLTARNTGDGAEFRIEV